MTDAFAAGSLETGHALLTPKVIAPSSTDLALRNDGNQGGLSVSNQSGKVTIAIGLKLGGGGIEEINTGGVRALTLAHDVGTNLVCGQVTVLSMDAATGATV